MSKIAVEINRSRELKPDVKRLVQLSSGWQSRDLHYRKKCALRASGIPAILHVENRHTGDHQVEIIDADTMGYETILRTLSSVVACNVEDLRLMRIDLSADVPGVSLDWFRTHVRVPKKRTHEIFGKQSKVGNKRTTGLFYGDTHDLIRIYDKLQELAYKHNPLDFPFASWSGPSIPQAVTRVERQLRGKKVPAGFGFVHSLSRMAEFDPFRQIRFERSRQVPFGRENTVRTVLASRGLQELVEKDGPQVATLILNKYSGGKASRLMKSLSRFEDVENPDLYEIYRTEVLAQLEAA